MSIKKPRQNLRKTKKVFARTRALPNTITMLRLTCVQRDTERLSSHKQGFMRVPWQLRMKKKSSSRTERNTGKSKCRIQMTFRTRRTGKFPLTQTHARYVIDRRRKEARGTLSFAIDCCADHVGCVARKSKHIRHQPVRCSVNRYTHRNTGGRYGGI